jgi:hypothetical protein
MRVLIIVLVLASICCPSIRHVIERESMKVFTDDRDRDDDGFKDDLNACTAHVYYASGFRPIVTADFHYGFGGLLAAASDPYGDYFDEIDAAITLPIMRFALAEGR